MLNLFPVLRRISIPTPRFISRFLGKRESSSPLVIGLLNGLMIACGPLQAIYIMAAGTGSMIEGAKLLFIFGLGTLPVMLGFGYFASFVSSKITHRLLKASGIIIIILGMLMINNGLALTGSGYDIRSVTQTISGKQGNTVAKSSLPLTASGYQEIRMTVDSRGFTPNTFVLKRGVPVKWIIDGKQLNSCNKAIQVPAYNLKFEVKPGEQTIEFTPDKEGTIRWSCWMGMIQGVFVVKDNVDTSNPEAVEKELSSLPATAPSQGSCGGGGSCGCGMMK
jgi:hypothetical protein